MWFFGHGRLMQFKEDVANGGSEPQTETVEVQDAFLTRQTHKADAAHLQTLVCSRHGDNQLTP